MSNVSSADLAYLGLYVVAVIAISYGVLNLTVTRLRPHHVEFLGKPTSPVVIKFVLKSLRIIGLFMVAYGIAIACMAAIPLHRGERWAWWLLTVLNIVVLPGLTVITYSISKRGPWPLSFLAFVLFTAALIRLSTDSP